jgi:tRNA (mo5U34)-methyltransferase
MKEKKINLGGFQVGVATDARRFERIRQSLPYRLLIGPGIRLVSGRGNGRKTSPIRKPESTSAPHVGTNGKADPKVVDKVASIGWYHTIDLGNGIVTPGFIDNRDTVSSFGLPDDLTGKRCLDIGTYDGFWSFEMERRGASEVIGIDVDSPLDHDLPRQARAKLLEMAGVQGEQLRNEWDRQQAQRGIQYPGDGFRLAKEILRSNARRENINVYDVSPETLGKFDVVLISQLLLRLRDPQTVIENMFSVTDGIAIVAEPFDPDLESLNRPVSEFLGTSLMGIWWRHSVKSMRRMMEVAGFDPIEEVSRFEATNREGKFSKVILKGHTPKTSGANDQSRESAQAGQTG